MTRKMIIVPRGTHPDGPYRKAIDGDRILIPRIGFTPFTVAGQKAVGAGGVGYCSNGDAGDPTGCCHDGTIWRKFALGSEISPIPPAKIFTASKQNSFHALTSDDGITQDFIRTEPPGAPGGTIDGWYSMWMSPDHQTIWLGGYENHADIAAANTFWRSLDGGDTWANLTATHPYGEAGIIHSIFGFDVDNLWASGDVWNAFHGVVLRWNTGTSLWDVVYDYGMGWTPNCLWGRASDDMYCVTYSAAALCLLRENGGGWAAEGGGAGDYWTVINTGQTGKPVTIVGDATHLYIFTETGVPGIVYEIYRGTFGGTDWVKEVRSWAATAIFTRCYGRNIGVDETGAIWLSVSDLGHAEVHRRDPTTGVWALHGGPFAAPDSNNCVNLVVIDSSHVFVFSSTTICAWDGISWTEYETIDIVGYADLLSCGGSCGYIP